MWRLLFSRIQQYVFPLWCGYPLIISEVQWMVKSVVEDTLPCPYWASGLLAKWRLVPLRRSVGFIFCLNIEFSVSVTMLFNVSRFIQSAKFQVFVVHVYILYTYALLVFRQSGMLLSVVSSHSFYYMHIMYVFIQYMHVRL